MISERVGKKTTKKEKKGWKVGFSKHLSAVNRRSKSNSPANCANYEIAGDVRFRFNRRPPSPLTISFVSREKEGKEKKKKGEGTTWKRWRERFVAEASGSKKRRHGTQNDPEIPSIRCFGHTDE